MSEVKLQKAIVDNSLVLAGVGIGGYFIVSTLRSVGTKTTENVNNQIENFRKLLSTEGESLVSAYMTGSDNFALTFAQRFSKVASRNFLGSAIMEQLYMIITNNRERDILPEILVPGALSLRDTMVFTATQLGVEVVADVSGVVATTNSSYISQFASFITITAATRIVWMKIPDTPETFQFYISSLLGIATGFRVLLITELDRLVSGLGSFRRNIRGLLHPILLNAAQKTFGRELDPRGQGLGLKIGTKLSNMGRMGENIIDVFVKAVEKMPAIFRYIDDFLIENVRTTRMEGSQLSASRINILESDIRALFPRKGSTLLSDEKRNSMRYAMAGNFIIVSLTFMSAVAGTILTTVAGYKYLLSRRREEKELKKKGRKLLSEDGLEINYGLSELTLLEAQLISIIQHFQKLIAFFEKNSYEPTNDEVQEGFKILLFSDLGRPKPVEKLVEEPKKLPKEVHPKIPPSTKKPPKEVHKLPPKQAPITNKDVVQHFSVDAGDKGLRPDEVEGAASDQGAANFIGGLEHDLRLVGRALGLNPTETQKSSASRGIFDP